MTNPAPRYNCPACGRLIRAKPEKRDNGDGTETAVLRIVPHGVGLTKAKSLGVNKAYPCRGGGMEVGE